MMKKVWIFLLCALLIVSVGACKRNKKDDKEGSAKEEQTSISDNLTDDEAEDEEDGIATDSDDSDETWDTPSQSGGTTGTGITPPDGSATEGPYEQESEEGSEEESSQGQETTGTIELPKIDF